MTQKIEAATRDLRDQFEIVENNPRDRRASGDAIRSAWDVLMEFGFRDFNDIKDLHTDDWVSTFDPLKHRLLALALEIVGWYQFGLRPHDIDRTARIFDRALELTPSNLRALERFAIVVNTLRPEHIGGLAKFPKKQCETALGYKLQCKRKIDNSLLNYFGISEAHLLGKASESLRETLDKRTKEERSSLFELLGHLAKINIAVGDFFGNGTQLSLGMGAACCQLEMLGLPREINATLDLLKDGDRSLWNSEERELLCEILTVISELCECKWRIFKNQAAHRRQLEILQSVRSFRRSMDKTV
jgi:hypothetical protein